MELNKEHIRLLFCFHQKKNIVDTHRIIYETCGKCYNY